MQALAENVPARRTDDGMQALAEIVPARRVAGIIDVPPPYVSIVPGDAGSVCDRGIELRIEIMQHAAQRATAATLRKTPEAKARGRKKKQCLRRAVPKKV